MTPSRTDPEDLAKIAQQHRQLRETLTKVVATTTLESLVPLLKQLREQIREHFADEEGEGGLAEAIGESAPRHARAIETLFDEHREFLETIGGLIEQSETLLTGPKAKILRDVKALAAGLHEHEAKETELLQDSVYTDIGAGD